MNAQLIRDGLNECFARLVERYGFRSRNEVIEEASNTYSVEYVASFVVTLETYRGEVYATLGKEGTDSQVNLFNLLDYLNLGPSSEYFRDELDIGQRWRKQLCHIAAAIEVNLGEIKGFFDSGEYAAKMSDVEAFMLKKYPALFGRVKKFEGE